jgi:hypothetical protein
MKALVSLTPEIKMDVLLGLSPAGRQVLATWAGLVVPTGVPLRGPDTSLNVRPSAASDEAVCLDESRPLAGGVSCPPGFCGGDRSGCYSRVRRRALGGPELPAARSGVFARSQCGPDVGRWSPAGRLRRAGGSVSSLAFLFAAS